MPFDFLRNPNFSNYSSPIYDDESDFVMPKPIITETPPPSRRVEKRDNLTRLYISSFVGLLAVVFVFSLLKGFSATEIQNLLLTVAVIFLGLHKPSTP